MVNDKCNVMDWLNDMAHDEKWPCYYSDSELRMLAKDALELLKEQEPKLVKIDGDGVVLCPSCGNELFTYPQQKFCDECGQAVKWE